MVSFDRGAYQHQLTDAQARKSADASDADTHNGMTLQDAKNPPAPDPKPQETFGQLAQEWLAIKAKKWTLDTHDRAKGILTKHVLPIMGSLPEHSCQRIVQPLQNAGGAGHSGNERTRATRTCSARDGAADLHLLMLLTVRPSELRQTLSSDFDLSAGLWKVPAGRKKECRDFQLPLPRQMLAPLKELHRRNGAYPPLPPRRAMPKEQPISDLAFNNALDRMGDRGAQTLQGRILKMGPGGRVHQACPLAGTHCRCAADCCTVNGATQRSCALRGPAPLHA